MDKNNLIYNFHSQDASIFKSKEFRFNFLFEEEISSFLYEKEASKVFFIQGIQGSGKTLFIENISKRYATDDNFLYIPFFENITLDDIYLQLYYQIKNSSQSFILNKNANDPIDIRIINILKDKSIKKNIVLDNVNEVDTKILNFIKFLTEKAQNTSIIMAGSSIDSDIEPFIQRTINLKPLNQSKIINLLSFYDIEFSNKVLSQLAELTNIYTTDVFKLIALIKEKNIKLFDIVMKYSTSKDSFEFFLEKELSVVFKDFTNTLYSLALFKFPIQKSNFLKLFGEELKDEIDKLISLQVIKNDRGYLSIDEDKKQEIIELIDNEEWYENVLIKLEHQASLSIKDRNLYISRGTINNHIEEFSKLLDRQPIKKMESRLKKNRTTNKSDYAYLNTNMDISNEDISSLMISDFEQELLENKDFDMDENVEGLNIVKPKVNIEKLIKRAFEYEKEKQYQACLDCLKDALEEAEDKKDFEKIIFILNKMSNIYSRINDFENCIKTLKHALNMASIEEDKDKQALINFHMGKCYKKFFKYEEAKNAFIDFLNSQIGNENFKLEAILSVAGICFESKEYDEALKFYKEIINTPTKIRNKSEALFYTALIYDEKDDVKLALTTYQKCIELSDDAFENKFLAPSYGNIANILYEAKDNVNAIIFYEKALEKDIEVKNYEGKFFTYSKLGNIMYEDKEFKKALNYFKKKLKTALRLDKSYHIAESYMDIGDTFLKVLDFSKARKCYVLAKKCIDDSISIESIEKIEKRLSYIKKHQNNG